MNKLQASGINEQLNLHLVTRKRSDGQWKKLASDIDDMFLYYVKRSDIFPKDVLAKGCKYIDIIDKHTVEQPVNDKALEERIPIAEMRYGSLRRECDNVGLTMNEMKKKQEGDIDILQREIEDCKY